MEKLGLQLSKPFFFALNVHFLVHTPYGPLTLIPSLHDPYLHPPDHCAN